MQVGEGAAPAHRHPPVAQGVGLGDLPGSHVLLDVRPDVDRGLPTDDLLDQRAVGILRLRHAVALDRHQLILKSVGTIDKRQSSSQLV